MQEFYDSEAANNIRLTDDEAKALIALHARRHESRAQPNLHELASALNISDVEAMALLTELRSQNATRAMVPPAPRMVVPQANGHRIPAYVWAVAAAVVLFWIFVGGTLLLSHARVSPVAEPATTVPVETYTAPVPEAAMSPSTGVAIDRDSVVVKSGDKAVVIQHGASSN